MAINSISYSGSLFGQQVLNLNNQLTNLSTELATGEKSTTYAGMGIGESFAIAARQQLSNISAYNTTQTNVNTTIDAENTALQSLTSIANTVQNDASTTSQTINSNGQTVGQENAQAQLGSMLGILNTQVGDRYIFSGSAISTPMIATVTSSSTKVNACRCHRRRCAREIMSNACFACPYDIGRPPGRLIPTAAVAAKMVRALSSMK